VHTATLFIPALFWPYPGIPHDAPVAPALRKLLGRADYEETLCGNEDAWLCQQFGVARQIDWPVAPIALLGTARNPGQDFWLRADPVHLQVNRDQLILTAPEGLSISDTEASSMVAALNHHFAADHFSFVAPEADRWYLRTPGPARIVTQSLSQVAGRDIDGLLPDGEDKLAWHRFFNEVQMVLHEHPVNEERELRGVPPINSLWFSGGGILPRACADFNAVIASSALARGLSNLADIPLRPAVQNIAELNADHVLIELRAAETASMRLDPTAWKHTIEVMHQRWFAPMVSSLRRGHSRRLFIATVHRQRALRWSITRKQLLWRVWRSTATLAGPVRDV
jgi:hypothetical protein